MSITAPAMLQVDWLSLGQHYRTGLFLGSMFEMTAQGYVLALISRYFSLRKQRQPKAIELLAVYGAGIIGIIQISIHCDMVYQNGLSNYLQIRRLALDDDWQMKSIWITSSLVWAAGAGVFLGVWRQNGVNFKGKALTLACLLILSFATASSGFTAGVVRCFFPGNAIATVAGVTRFPESFGKVRPLLYLHYSLNLFAQMALSFTAVVSLYRKRKGANAQESQSATIVLYFKHTMLIPLLFAAISLACFIALPGTNLELVAFLPFSAASLGSVISILNCIATTMAQDNSSWPSSSAITSFGSGGSQPQHHKSASKTRVVIPVERVEVVQISDKDSRYSPKVGLNRLPYNGSQSTVGQDAYEENDKVSLNRPRVPSL